MSDDGAEVEPDATAGGDRLALPVPASVAARRAGVSAGAVRRFEQTGVVPPSARSDRGAPLYVPDDIRRLTAAHTLEKEAVLTTDEVKRILDAGEVVAAIDQALDKATTPLERRTVVAMVLAELEDVRRLVGRRASALIAAAQQVELWEQAVRDSGAGPAGGQRTGAARARR